MLASTSLAAHRGLRAGRELSREHFAFMRALAQGLDERSSWERYLGMPGERIDARNIRRTVSVIRDAFAAAARREGRPGTARLVLIDPSALTEAKALPSLEAFARERGLEDFSEQEQAEAYADAFGAHGAGSGRQRQSRRSRIVARQLEALRWLETRVVQDPTPHDPIGFWLPPALAERLEKSGIATISQLHHHIDAQGYHWFRKLPGIGAGKAARIIAWMQQHQPATGFELRAHVLVAPEQLPVADRARVVRATTGLVPLEKLLIPDSQGGEAVRTAVEAWIAAQPAAASRRVYRKWAERLLLWATLVCDKPLWSLDAPDLEAWLRFLADPPQDWLGSRRSERWSPRWRPMEGPMPGSESARARRLALALVALAKPAAPVVECLAAARPFQEPP